MTTYQRRGRNSFITPDGWIILFDPTRTQAWRLGENLEGGLVMDAELSGKEFTEALAIMESLG